MRPRGVDKLPVLSPSRIITSNNICLISKLMYYLLKDDYEEEEGEDQEDGKKGRRKWVEGERKESEYSCFLTSFLSHYDKEK